MSGYTSKYNKLLLVRKWKEKKEAGISLEKGLDQRIRLAANELTISDLVSLLIK